MHLRPPWAECLSMCLLAHIPMKMPLKILPTPFGASHDAVRDEEREEDSSSEAEESSSKDEDEDKEEEDED